MTLAASLRPYVLPGLRQLRRLWVPFFAIQLLGLAVVVGYFAVPAMQRALDAASDLKSRGGIAANALTLAFACAILPEVFKAIAGVDRTWTRGRLTFVVHNVVVFGAIGSVQGFFYDGLAAVFGGGRTPGVIVAKTLVDQFVYSPFFSVLLVTFSFTLRARHYRLGEAARQLGVAWYLREAVPVLVVNWAYWFPMGLLMYTLPPKMTFVYGALASAASATLLTAVASADARAEVVAEKAQAEKVQAA